MLFYLIHKQFLSTMFTIIILLYEQDLPVPLRSWLKMMSSFFSSLFASPYWSSVSSSAFRAIFPISDFTRSFFCSPDFPRFRKRRRVGEIGTRTARTPCARATSRPRRPLCRSNDFIMRRLFSIGQIHQKNDNYVLLQAG